MLDVPSALRCSPVFLSFVSPCVLPIVPPYLAYLAGVSFNELEETRRWPSTSRRIVLVFDCLRRSASRRFRRARRDRQRDRPAIARYFDTLSIVAGVLIIVMGLHFIGVFRIAPALSRGALVEVERKPAGCRRLSSWGSPSPSAGRPVSVRCWRRSFSWPAPNGQSGTGRAACRLFARNRHSVCSGSGFRQPGSSVRRPASSATCTSRDGHGRASRRHRRPLHHWTDVGNCTMAAGNVSRPSRPSDRRRSNADRCCSCCSSPRCCPPARASTDGRRRAPQGGMVLPDLPGYRRRHRDGEGDGKRLVLIFEQRGCIYCKKMHEKMLTDPEVPTTSRRTSWSSSTTCSATRR